MSKIQQNLLNFLDLSSIFLESLKFVAKFRLEFIKMLNFLNFGLIFFKKCRIYHL